MTSAMTGGGQRMPSTHQAIVLRPGNPGQLPGGSPSTVGGRPQIMQMAAGSGSPAIRVQGPGIVTRGPAGVTAAAAITANRNVVINQPGMRPGTPGSQITVPLQTLQTMQPGQGIPTGQAGHLLVKTENGQYQILRVGPSSASATATNNISVSSPTVRPTSIASVRAPGPAPAVAKPVVTTVAQPPQQQQQQQQQQQPPTTAASTTASSGSSSSGGGMGTQMTPDTAKHKCKNFLATLLRLAGEQPPVVATNVRNLIQGLIDGKVEPETFTTKLQKELNSSPQPCLVPFLKKSLPFLQQSLSSGELTIDGVRAPAGGMPATHKVVGPAVNQVMRPPMHQVRQNIVVSARGAVGVGSTIVRPAGVGASPTRPVGPATQQRMVHAINTMSMSNNKFGAPTAMRPPVPVNNNVGKPAVEKKASSSGGSYSVAGDEDINDVAAMGGVNIAEESQRMQVGHASVPARSCKDETFLLTGQLQKRVAKLCKDRGLDEPPADVVALVSHATQDRLKTMLEKLSVIAEHRLDVVARDGGGPDAYDVTQDVKGQLRFLGELDKIERKRHEEAERELLLRAVKSRTKTEDPEKEKLKAKAKEIQRLEEEQMRHDKANSTALMAIGGPRKKMRLDTDVLAASSASSASASASGGLASNAMAARPRTKRVHVRDLLFLMEQERELKRSPLLWKAYCS